MCDQTKMYGGPQIIGGGHMAQIDIPTPDDHDYVVLAYTPVFIDNWEGNEHQFLEVNRKPVASYPKSGVRTIKGGECRQQRFANQVTTYPTVVY